MTILTKIFGVDHVKTEIFKSKDDAMKEVTDDARVISEDNFDIKSHSIERKNGKIYITINNSDNAYDAIVYVISELREETNNEFYRSL